MAISRRALLAGAALLPLAGCNGHAGTGPRFVGAAAVGRGYAVRCITLAGEPLWETWLPSRGHGFAAGAAGVVAFARRPGSFALLLDPQDGQILAEIAPPAGCTFNGHGLFVAGGARLVATATRESDDSGRVSVHARDAGWRAVATWPTLGRDPHEIVALSDRLIVANGGWAEGRMPEAGAPVASSLVALDPRDGRVLRQWSPPAELEAISLRHMARCRDAVAVAAQTRELGLPTVLVLESAGWRVLPPLPVEGYCGSVAANGATLCVASPVAGAALTLALDGTILARESLADVCGVAPAGDAFLLSTGHGELVGPDIRLRQPGLRWDNHLAALV